jgi:hypothetical protein
LPAKFTTTCTLGPWGAEIDPRVKEMSERLSLSIFTIEADRNPIFAVQCRKHSEAEVILTDGALLAQMNLVRSGGKPLCDDFSVFRVRLARENERDLYFQNTSSLLSSNGLPAVLLVKLDSSS